MNVRMQTETIGRDETKLSYVYGQAGVTADLGQKYLVLTFEWNGLVPNRWPYNIFVYPLL